MKVFNFEQRSEEWFEARLGKVTGSKASKMYAKNNLPLIDTILAELLTGKEESIFTTDAMQRGIDLEPSACYTYEKTTGLTVEHVGICVHDSIDMLALSPDGWVDNRKGGVEFKCPSSKKHIQYIRQGGIPSEYAPQILHYFLVNEKCQFVDFASYDPRVKSYPFYLERVYRKDWQMNIDQGMEEVKKFEKKLNKYLTKFQ